MHHATAVEVGPVGGSWSGAHLSANVQQHPSSGSGGEPTVSGKNEAGENREEVAHRVHVVGPDPRGRSGRAGVRVCRWLRPLPAQPAHHLVRPEPSAPATRPPRLDLQRLPVSRRIPARRPATGSLLELTPRHPPRCPRRRCRRVPPQLHPAPPPPCPRAFLPLHNRPRRTPATPLSRR